MTQTKYKASRIEFLNVKTALNSKQCEDITIGLLIMFGKNSFRTSWRNKNGKRLVSLKLIELSFSLEYQKKARKK